jgi:hypothetical protein
MFIDSEAIGVGQAVARSRRRGPLRRPLTRLAAGLGLGALLAVVALACRRDPTPTAAAQVAAAASAPATAALESRLPKSDLVPIPVAGRLVLVGDLHGDLDVARRVLQLAGATDAKGQWVGGSLVLVLLGDLLDRGDQERPLVDWVAELEVAAPAAGGRVVVLSGNHEALNVSGDLRYVTSAGMTAFADLVGPGGDPKLAGMAPPETHGRLLAFLPGGTYARRLAAHPAVAVVGDTLVAHGGVLPEHVRYGLERFNRELAAWMKGAAAPTLAVTSDQSPLWTRQLGERKVPGKICRGLDAVLEATGTRRLVVGHTVQDKGIDAACDRHLWRIDVGLARFYGGPSQVLEVTAAGEKVLGEPKPN